jgi:hypothetical protein
MVSYVAYLSTARKSLDEFTEKDMQDEYTKHMNGIDWPNLLLQPRPERDAFGPDVEPDTKKSTN